MAGWFHRCSAVFGFTALFLNDIVIHVNLLHFCVVKSDARANLGKALFATLDCISFSAILVTSSTCSASWTDNALSSIGRCDKKKEC